MAGERRVSTKPFLYDFQMEAVKKARNGSILNGSVGSGKSRTGLFYYFKENGGWIEGSDYTPMIDCLLIQKQIITKIKLLSTAGTILRNTLRSKGLSFS